MRPSVVFLCLLVAAVCGQYSEVYRPAQPPAYQNYQPPNPYPQQQQYQPVPQPYSNPQPQQYSQIQQQVGNQAAIPAIRITHRYFIPAGPAKVYYRRILATSPEYLRIKSLALTQQQSPTLDDQSITVLDQLPQKLPFASSSWQESVSQ